MKKFLHIVFIISFNFVYSQNLNQHINVFTGLNNYMEFIHQTTHCEYIMYFDFKNYNSSLLTKSIYKTKSEIFFEKEDYLNDNSYYEKTPAEIYNICLNQKFNITKKEKEVLDISVIKMMKYIEMLQFYNISIYNYNQSEEIKNDTTFSKGYSLLDSCSKYFIKYKNEWYILNNEINIIAQKYESNDIKNPFINVAKNLDSLFDVVYKISEAALQNDTITVNKLKYNLEYFINKYDKSEDIYLKGAQKIGSGSGLCPYSRFDNVIFDAKAELSHTISYLKKAKYPSNTEKTYGKNLYYYNELFINKFNRHGLGMAYEYNNLADISGNIILKKAQMPHVFIAIKPKTNKIIVVNNNQNQTENKTENQTFTLKNAPPNNLIFLLDVSGSMNSLDKMPVLKEAIKYLVSLMRDYDYISIVTYSGDAKIVLNHKTASQKDSIYHIIDKLIANGKTDLFPGLKISYNLANTFLIPSGNNKILLATDGDFETDKKTSKLISKNSKNITFSVLYFNQGNFNYNKLEELAKKGNGTCQKITKENIIKTLVIEAGGN